MKTMLFIMNPFAGQKRANRVLPDILLLFSQAGYDIHTVMTTGTGAATRAAQTQAGSVDLVVCCGGDGTLNETITGLLRSGAKTPLGYIPTGTTNDFAASLGLSHNPVQAAKDILEGEVHAYDAGRFGERYFSYVASFGAFTKASYSASQETKNALGHFAYILEGIKNLDSLRPYRCGVEADGESFDGDFIFGGVSNSTSVAGMVRLRKDLVSLGDGLFETLLIRRPKQFGDLSRIITGVLNQYYDNENVILVQSKNLRFTFEEPVAWTRDGEAGGVTTDVRLSNNHAAIHIIA